MRTYGRVFSYNPDGTKTVPQPNGFPYWVTVETDPTTGESGWVYITALCQVLQGVLGESPFYASYGIPGQQAVIQQIAPDFYVSRAQQQFAQFFASLIVSKDAAADVPTYNVNAMLFNGTSASVTVQPPQ